MGQLSTQCSEHEACTAPSNDVSSGVCTCDLDSKFNKTSGRCEPKIQPTTQAPSGKCAQLKHRQICYTLQSQIKKTFNTFKEIMLQR